MTTLVPTFSPAAMSPAAMPTRRTVQPVATITVAAPEPNEAAKSVTLGTVTEPVLHDGVVKAKHLRPGQVVRAWLHGEPRGSERTVDTVERIDEGANVRITFSSPHPDTVVKAAYRYHDVELVGMPAGTVTRRTFVEA